MAAGLKTGTLKKVFVERISAEQFDRVIGSSGFPVVLFFFGVARGGRRDLDVVYRILRRHREELDVYVATSDCGRLLKERFGVCSGPICLVFHQGRFLQSIVIMNDVSLEVFIQRTLRKVVKRVLHH